MADSESGLKIKRFPLLFQFGRSIRIRITYFVKDSADFVTLLRKSPRPFPFIIGIGNKFNVIVDESALTFLEDKVEDASLCLIATYYVLGVQWCPDIEPTYLFIKKNLLKISDDKANKSKEVAIFCNLMISPEQPE